MQRKIATFYTDADPWGECEELIGFSPSGFHIHVEDFVPPHLITVIPTAGGEASEAAAQPRCGAAKGAAESRSQGG